MNVGDARAVAVRWVAEHAAGIPNFVGAFLSGSAAWLPDQAELPNTSDIDVMVVRAERKPPPKPGKVGYGGTLLDVTYLAWEQIRSRERVLASYHLAGAFRTDTMLADPTGRLAETQAAVADEYARRPWVRRRCADAERRIIDGLGRIEPDGPLHDQVVGWLFPAGVTTHVLLTAGLRNPTIRLRYPAVRDLLRGYGRLDFYEELLRLLGCAALTRERAERHLRAMAEAFDAASAVTGTPFPFASDISARARPIAVDGSRELIERNDHREAMFWITATYARSVKILKAGGPVAIRDGLDDGFTELLRDMGIASPVDLRRRAEGVREFLPLLREIQEEILARNPDIRD